MNSKLACTIVSCFISIAVLMAQSQNFVIAHRGAWKSKQLPENSIASLQEAIRLGCGGSEFDVRMTADDSLVINHDPSFHELTIERTNYKELMTFPLSNGEKLPTLREYILTGIGEIHPTKLVIEIKPSEISKERGKRIAQKVQSMVHELNAQQRVVYISFDYNILLEILKTEKNALTQYLEGDKDPEQLKKDGISGCDFHYAVYIEHPDWIRIAKKERLTLNVWTVNDEDRIRWTIENGFDQVTTNEPILALMMMQAEGTKH